MVCMSYGKEKKGNQWVLRDIVRRVNVLHKCQNNVLHQHNSHLVMYGVDTGSSIFRLHMCSTY